MCTLMIGEKHWLMHILTGCSQAGLLKALGSDFSPLSRSSWIRAIVPQKSCTKVRYYSEPQWEMRERHRRDASLSTKPGVTPPLKNLF